MEANLALLPEPWWPVALLAFVVLGDALLSIRPPRFIQGCLDGVKFPRDWWWALILIKVVAAAGLVAGIFIPGVVLRGHLRRILGALAAGLGAIVYFPAAVVAHLRARFTGSEFWLNCLGMLALSSAVLIISFLA